MTVMLSRIMRYGWQGFLRNGSLSISTVGIMLLAAIVFEGLILFNVAGKGTLTSIQEKIDISVYFKTTTAEDSILTIKRSLDGLKEVKEVTYVSKEEALEIFKTRHAGEDAITQTLNELNTNPLLSSINIKAQDPHQYQSIANYLEHPDLKDIIEKVDYAQNQVVIERLVNIIDTMRIIGIALTIFLALLAIIITFNTIRLAIFSSSEQVGIMRLVGASNMFIRGPYIVEGIIYGALAALVSFFLLFPIIYFASPYITKFIPEADLSVYFQTQYLSLLFSQLAFCIGLGIVSSVIAIRKYLHI